MGKQFHFLPSKLLGSQVGLRLVPMHIFQIAIIVECHSTVLFAWSDVLKFNSPSEKNSYADVISRLV